MKKAVIILSFMSILILDACKSVPLTGRRQAAWIPNSELNSLSYAQYQAVKDSSKVIRGTADSDMIERCGKRIQKAVETYFANHNMQDDLKGFEWEFILIDEPIVNAWCMPGGKVAFYTGILPICKNEEGVAVVMGHEIAHAVARHGNERMTQALMTSFGSIALAAALNEQKEETQLLFLAAYGLGAQIGFALPFSRKHESEADRLGMIFMAMAGYDPAEAPAFWERMAANSGGGAPPEFLSTHPSHESRIKNLNSYIPEAEGYRGAAR